jgi:uncharacterized protein
MSVKALWVWLVVLLVISMALPAPVSAQEQPDPLTIAQTLLDNLIAGDFTAATAHFDSTMAGALPPAALEQTWATLQQQVGAFQGQLGTSAQTVSGYTVVLITLQFEHMVLAAQIAVSEEGLVGGLHFVPAEAPAPAEPPAYADFDAFTEQDVTVGTGAWALPGTLALPSGEGPFPALVLVHGSGPNDRDETIGPNKPFRDLAWGLASNGIAVLRYDKRTLVHGVAMVESGEFTVDDETVDDALAAVELLRGVEAIDADRVFVLGHSLGGMMAPRIASRDAGLAGVIILAGSTRPLTDIYQEQIAYLLALDTGLSDEERARLLDETARLVDATRAVDPGDDLATLLFNAPPSYWLDLNAYDPVSVARTLAQPLFILQGERDYQVTLVDFQGWQDGLAGREDVTFKLYPDLNHLFISGEGPITPAEYELAGHVAAEVIEDIARWILAR